MLEASTVIASSRQAARRAFMLAALTIWLAAAMLGGLVAPPSANGLSRWTGGIDLYRSGVYTRQQTLLWCTAADVQIVRNIVDHRADHSRAAQSRYFSWMRLHNRYSIPVTDGVDPAGWTAGLRHFVDDRYRLVESASFATALNAAVTSLRRTNLPVGLLVAHGDHAWVLTGFTATADPAATSSFTVTSVRVVGPLYGIQSRNGYDMPPDTKLTPAQLRRFWTPWHYARIRMAWEGRTLAIEGRAAAAVPASTASSAPKAPTANAAMRVFTNAPMRVSASAASRGVASSVPTGRVAAALGTGRAAGTTPAGSARSSGPQTSLPPPVLLALGTASALLALGLTIAVMTRRQIVRCHTR